MKWRAILNSKIQQQAMKLIKILTQPTQLVKKCTIEPLWETTGKIHINTSSSRSNRIMVHESPS